ncbi:MAG: peptidylprolyl isomerase [Bacteroidaceae bacterium]|nr:peptidylprolyl isomerase [Bacteroidaceae bacterium]
MKFNLFYIIALLSMMLVPEAKAQRNVIDEVVWVVGDEPILKSDVEQARLEAISYRMRIEGDPYCVIPEQLAVQKLFLHQAAIDSVEVSDSEIIGKVDEQLEEYVTVLGSKEKVEEYFGMTYAQKREQLTENFRNERMIQEVRQSLVKDIKVTPAMVRKHFKDMPEDSLPFVPTKVEVQIITREPVISPEEIERVKALLRDYTERVKSGSTKFSTLALMYSEDGSAQNGGEIGWSYKGRLAQEFADVAFKLTDPNTVSKIVETEFGFHIIQLIEKRGDRINCRHILKKPKASEESIMKAFADLDSISEELNKGLYTFEQCAQFVSHDKDTRNNYGIMRYVNNETGEVYTKMEMKELPAEVAKQVGGLQVGELSKPFLMTNSKGKEVVAIVKLKDKTEGHRATMKDDYQTLQDVVQAKMAEEKIEKWIKEKQKTTYVRINEDWRNCDFKYDGWIKK